MIRRPPRSTPKPSSAASDVYKRQLEAVSRRCLATTLATCLPVIERREVRRDLEVVTSILLTHRTSPSLDPSHHAGERLEARRASWKDSRNFDSRPGCFNSQKPQPAGLPAGSWPWAWAPDLRYYSSPGLHCCKFQVEVLRASDISRGAPAAQTTSRSATGHRTFVGFSRVCLLYTSPSPRDATLSRMPSSA